MITRMIQTTGRRKKRVRSILLSGAKRPDPPDRRPGHLNVAAHRRVPVAAAGCGTAHDGAANRTAPAGLPLSDPSSARDTAPSVTRRYTVGAAGEPVSPVAAHRTVVDRSACFRGKTAHTDYSCEPAEKAVQLRA